MVYLKKEYPGASENNNLVRVIYWKLLRTPCFYFNVGIEEEEEDFENISQAREDDMNETIMMSQHVFDDIEDVELNNENGLQDNDNNAGDNELVFHILDRHCFFYINE